MTQPRVGLRRKEPSNMGHEFQYIEPPGLADAVILGIASITSLGNGLVRVKLFGEENVKEGYRVISARHVLALDMGVAIAGEAGSAFLNMRGGV
jgi:hypothetical protein